MVATRKTASEDMVLFSADGGRINYSDLRDAISSDGKRRNLQWGLKDREHAIVKVNGDQHKENDHAHGATGGRTRWRTIQTPARYILSFKDSQEARRFVREWHRRPFPGQRLHKAGGEPPLIMNVEMFR